MTEANFIPVHRRLARGRQRRQRAWIGLCGGYTVVLACLAVLAVVAFGADPAGPGDQLSAYRARKTEVHETIDRTHKLLAPALSRLQATRTISVQPDWSILLAEIAAALGDDVFLRQVTLESPDEPLPAAGADAADKTDEPAPVVRVSIGGYGRTQAATAEFISQLETSGLFRRVHVLRTKRQKLMADEAVNFELSCELLNDATEAE